MAKDDIREVMTLELGFSRMSKCPMRGGRHSRLWEPHGSGLMLDHNLSVSSWAGLWCRGSSWQCQQGPGWWWGDPGASVSAVSEHSVA